jgi:ATP-dependent Clp protease ATP-binding subunit ClpX
MSSGSGIGFGAEVKSEQEEINIRETVTAVDVIKYGVIPEFMGRFPVLVGLDPLTEEQLVRVLTEPKNSIAAQFKKLFALDDVELEITDDALNAIAKAATENKTGARGLRTVIEKSLLKLQFKLPKLSREGLKSVHITGEFISNNADPILVFDESMRKTQNINE